MSSILKALRKLEEEKAALGQGRVDLARDILKRSARPRTVGVPLIFKLMIFGGLGLALVAGVWLLVKMAVPAATAPVVAEKTQDSKTLVNTAEKTIVHLEETTALVPAPIASTPSATKTIIAEPSIVTEVLPEKQPVRVEAVNRSKPPETTVKAAHEVNLTATADKPEAVEMTEGAIETTLPPSATIIEPPAVVPALPVNLPQLRIDAIAYKAAAGERLAVVNDLPVMEGTFIDGVEIVEILPGAIRFRWQGAELVVPLVEAPAAN